MHRPQTRIVDDRAGSKDIRWIYSTMISHYKFDNIFANVLGTLRENDLYGPPPAKTGYGSEV